MRSHTVWRLYFAGLNFRELLFENISLKKFREFAVKRHAHTMGVVYYTHLTRYHRPLRRCVVFCDTLFPTSTLSEFVFQIPGRSPNLRRIELAASVLADTAHVRWYLLGELSMWIRKLTLRLLSILTVEVHKQSHQASCDQCRACTLEYYPRSCRRTTLVKIFVEIISRMTCK